MRILIIDDNTDIRQFLQEVFETACFIVDTAENGDDGSYMARIHDYDAIILDHMLPRKNGAEVLRDLRSAKKTTPVIILSIQGEIDDKVDLLNLGADDYMTKPFSCKELVSRVQAIMRRPKTVTPTLIRVGDLTLDTLTQRIQRGKKTIYLTRKEYALAEYLMRNRGFVVSRGMLLDHVWEDGVDPASNTVETHIRNLRRKIEEPNGKKLIHTIPGRGYQIDAHRKIFD